MRSFELFSGAGGLALGLEKAGFEPVALVERDKHACATLRHNRPSWNIISDDVRNIDYSTFGRVGFVAGGPPCQPFSMGGKAAGYDDSRDMFPEAVRAVRELRPKAFLFENVRGLLRTAFQPYVEYIRLQLSYPDFPISSNISWEKNFQRIQRHHTRGSRSADESASEYKVSIHLADAADYGVPQRRHRVFFVGFRADVSSRWFFPDPTHSYDQLLVSKYIDREYWTTHGIQSPASFPESLHRRILKLQHQNLLPTALPWRTVRDALAGLGAPGTSKLTNHKHQSGAKSYPGHTGSPLDEPSKALKAGDHGVPGGENMLRHQNGKVRYYTIREAARIQTFPDSYTFPTSWTESMRQLGNAVPVNLAATIATSIAEKLAVKPKPSPHAG